jgi:small subunit ribosomal protein S4
MFTPLLNAVIPMDHKYLAEHDGSELAAGRGSGQEKPLDLNKINFGRNHVPYMHMTYAPIERRLDTAIFRALFASSVRQARQFVIHDQVRVNGKKVESPLEHCYITSSNKVRFHIQVIFSTQETCSKSSLTGYFLRRER